MLQKTQGIVLRSLKYNDTSLIVDVFTQAHGRVSYLVPVPKTRRGGMKSVLFRPLSMIAYESDHRPRLALQRLKEVHPLYVFQSLPYDPYKSAIALFLADFLCQALREEGENAALFTYLLYSIEWLDRCRADFANFHLVFLMRLSRFLGLYPNVEGYREGCCFDLRNACFSASLPCHADVVQPGEAGRLLKLVRMNYDTMHLFRMGRAGRNRLLDFILRYYRLHHSGFPELRSLEVLHGLFV